jgi:hypothetical protein
MVLHRTSLTNHQWLTFRHVRPGTFDFVLVGTDNGPVDEATLVLPVAMAHSTSAEQGHMVNTAVTAMIDTAERPLVYD